MKKIMFNDRYGLTQAVLDGRKTMTRRIIKGIYVAVIHLKYEGSFIGKNADGDSVILLPTYKIGEEVAVSQSYKNDDVLIYNAYNEDGTVREDGLQRHKEMLGSNGYCNKMFVKAEYMPHRIRITNTKAERLQDISEEDCLREGVEKWIGCYIVPGIMENHGKNNVCFDTPREAFAALIDRINGKGTWNRNPWNFVYESELIK